MEIRKITPDEVVEVLKGSRYAYESWSDAEVKPSALETINPNEVLAVFEDGKMASSLRNYSFKQSVRGIIKGMGGIGGVWTYPEYRNRGYVRELVQAAFLDMKHKGLSVSMLLPFKESFYSGFSYVTANSNLVLKAPLPAFMHHLDSSEGDWQFRRVPATEVKNEFQSFMMAVAPKQYHGTVLADFTDAQWQVRCKDFLCVFIEQSDQTRAIAVYRSNIESPTDRYINVPLMCWIDSASRLQLFRFFAIHRDQIHRLHMQIPFGTNFHQWFRDASQPYEATFSHSPWMIRVVDVEAAIAELPASKLELFTVAISDQFCKWNNGIFTIQNEDDKLRAFRHQSQLATQPEMKATIEGISALVYGTISVEEIEYRQWLEFSGGVTEGRKANIKAALQEWFPVLPIYNSISF